MRSLLISADRGSLGKEIFNVTIQIEETEGVIGNRIQREKERERERERERESERQRRRETEIVYV